MLTLHIKRTANTEATYDFWSFFEKCICTDPIKARDLTEAEIQEFVKHGADLDAKTEDKHLTACMFATQGGFIETAKALIKSGAHVDARDKMGETVLMIAADDGNIEYIKTFVGLGADVNAKTVQGYTACMYAAREGYTAAIQTLVLLGANLDAANKWGQTACMEAAYFGKTETVKTLAELGADIYIKDHSGKTALDMIKNEQIKNEIIEASKKYKLKHTKNQRLHKTASGQLKQRRATVIQSKAKRRPVKHLTLDRKMQILNTDKEVEALRHDRQHIVQTAIEGIHGEKHILAVRRRTNVQDLRDKEDIARGIKLGKLLKQLSR